jgi:hypothetical protein
MSSLPYPVPMDLVDGVSVYQKLLQNPDGTVSQDYRVDPVGPGRMDTIGNPNLADIGIIKAPGTGQVKLTVQLPTGTGFEAHGSADARLADTALNELIALIDATAVPDGQLNSLHLAAREFLNRAMAADAPVLLQSISTSGHAGAADPSTFGVVADGTAKTAILLDAQSLGNTAIRLENVGFGLVKGNLQVTASGEGALLFGDAASQHFKLGAGADIVHGGAGDDILNGGGGNDQLFGDAGNDLLSGGMGDDLLDGGAGIDVAYFEGSRAGYGLQVVDGHLKVMMKAPSIGNTDTLHNIEMLAFTEQGRGVAESIGRLYEAVLGRDANAAEVAYWQEAQERGTYTQLIANQIAHSPEAGNTSNSEFITTLYDRALDRIATQSELDYWVGKLESGFSRGGVALGIVNSEEKLHLTSGFDIGGSEVGVLVRLYDATFGRVPDDAGFNYWLATMERGMSAGDVADAFANVLVPKELPNAAANVVSDEAYIGLIFRTALHRDATAGEVNHYATLMHNDPLFDRGQVLLSISESQEHVQLVGAITSDIEVTGTIIT